ncbi:2-dehydro-3-deoxy-D-gluconate 5-dehydrogenase KduD [Phenylobacterium sp. LjRoot225]|uniref:2-dehydro-3-deoxy-D-gluconate 5-dehydrogenase KduD n=1 Tax=Phenylobacterium sp. LjRoot225 TaxID=3342285 RepID=UPI003ECEFBE5
MDIFNLEGQVALVTGANTGLGQGIAIGLAEAGADIVAVGRSAPDETARRVAALGRKFYAVSADLSSTEPIGRVIAEAYAAAGRLDILVNNAGMIRRAEALAFSEADWDAVMETNLKVAFFLAQAVARRWVADGRGGKILNVVSMLSFQGGVRTASYTASKSGLAGVTKLLANEWAAKGINVNAIAPGYFATNNTDALRADKGRNQDILARIPAGRWGKPEDLAGAAVFLASRASDYMHGAVVPVDGGWLAR